MGENSGIDYVDHSLNFWQGCHKISSGCKNCYMYREKKQYGQDPTRVVRSRDATFYQAKKWKEPARVFVCPWSDFFIEEADEWRDDAWAEMRKYQHLTWLIVTKRVENIAERLPSDWGEGWPNVWLIATVEDAHNRYRIPLLEEIPAAKRGLSIEPCLERIDLGRPYEIDFLLLGCESGANRRRMPLEWARHIRIQAYGLDIPLYIKQLDIDGKVSRNPGEWPEFLRVRELPASRGGEEQRTGGR